MIEALRRTRGFRDRGPAWRRAARRAANRAIAARERVRPRAGRLEWLFVATLNNSGSTALAGLVESAPGCVTLAPNAEGQWLVPELVVPDRWNPDLPVDWDLVRAVWRRAALRRGGPGRVVFEKSPQNLARMRPLMDAFAAEPVRLMALTRDPYAVCASWARRYPTMTASRRKLPQGAPPMPEMPAALRRFWGLGTVCGARMEMLRALEDRTALRLSYEALVADPAAAAARIEAVAPALGPIDPGVAVRVKDYGAQPLRDMNAEQVATLSADEARAVTAGLAPFEGAVAWAGYALRPPAAGAA